MSIKARLFGKPWKHRDAAVRAQAVADSNDPQLAAELGTIAEHDESASVRLAALQRINNEPFWLNARLRESDADILKAADAYLSRVALQQTGSEYRAERIKWLQQIDDTDFLRRAARQASDSALRQAALEKIDSPGFLGDCVVEEKDEQLALSLVSRISQESTLERILETLRRRSKNRAQAVSERLATLRAERGDHDLHAQTAEALVERAEKLARGQFEGDRRAEFDALQKAWESAVAPEVLKTRFEGSMRIVQRSFESTGRLDKPVAEQSGEDSDMPATTQETGALAQFVEQLEALNNTDALPAQKIAGLLSRYDRLWQDIGSPGEAEEALRQRALPVLSALQKRHQALLAQKPGRQTDHAAAAKAQKAQDETDWTKQLDQLAGQIEAGDAAAAQALARSLRSRLDKMPRRARPGAATGRLTRLEGRLRELRNWEHWSNNQRRDELIEKVQQLIGSDQHPDAISNQLREARREWQKLEKLEVLPGDRRRFAAPRKQWQRFQRACKSAFEQAQPFFEKRLESQSQSLEQLEVFIARAHEAAEHSDSSLKTILKFQRNARRAIRRLDDIPPKSRGRSAAQLRELMEKLSKRLDQEFEAIELAKRRLIREAEALAHETDLNSAAEQAKALQARWQRIGSGRRRVEQALWQEFRAPIDPIFEKLGEEHAQVRAEREAAQAEYRQLVEQARAIAGDDDIEASESAAQMRALEGQWEAVGGQPGRLREQFEKQKQAIDERLRARQLEARQQEQEQLREMAGRLQALWQARLEGKPFDELPAIAEPAASASHKSLAAAMEKFGDADADTDALKSLTAENAAVAREVLVRLEFLAGLESPEHDRQARMDFQVQRLAQRMTERDSAPNPADEAAELEQRWYAHMPHPPDEHQDLAKRFEKCQNALVSFLEF
ncbi:MAG TPA: DUF349 domain-containing protein [Wenzhouxiangella sp.]|nr:DUF349 domain-containing protein [Wenzhouxiangella sp.]